MSGPRPLCACGGLAESVCGGCRVPFCGQPSCIDEHDRHVALPALASASALVRNCGYQRKLNRERPRSSATRAAMDAGSFFHRLVEGHSIEEARAEFPKLDDFDVRTAVEWANYFAASWPRPAGLEHEVALGLSLEGKYVPVEEPEPHVYVTARDTGRGVKLLTAGRADLVWVEADVVHVADLKTGRHHVGEPGRRLQNLALGFAAADRARCPLMRLGVYYARDGVWEWSDLIALGTPAAAELFIEVEQAALLDETPRPGPWCSGCWERKGCASAWEGDEPEAA